MNSLLKDPLLQIHTMQQDDIAVVMELEHRAYPFPWTAGNFRDCIRSNYYCCVYRQGERCVGYAVMSVKAGEAQVLNICIDPDVQGRGLGRRLMGHLVEVAWKRDADTVFLEVRVSNLAAYALYSSMGFNEVGMRPDYYPAKDGREDAMVLALSLQA
jgi:[ribosomal protein S18]-alanine N-acetyltransferase